MKPQAMFYKPEKVRVLWDTWMYYHQGTYYLYYLLLEPTERDGSHGHGICMARSTDGVNWSETGLIFMKDPDATGLGTGSVWPAEDFERSGTFVMNFSEWFDWTIQSQFIRFAESKDLVHWQRLDQDTDFKADPRWYTTFPDEKRGSRWDCIYTIRRPGGGRYGYWTATPRERPGFGFGEALDGVHWRALPPPVVEGGPSGMGNVEAGAIEALGGRYYMMVGAFGRLGRHGMFTFIADQPQGPFRPAEKNPFLLTSEGHLNTYFARFFPTPDGMLVNHHSIAKNNGGNYFAPLKRAVVDTEGTLRLGWWSGNEKLKVRIVDIAEAAEPSSPVMLDAHLDPDQGFILEGDMLLPRGHEQQTGVFIETVEQDGEAFMVQPGGAVVMGRMQLAGLVLVQEERVDRAMTFGEKVRFRLLVKHSLSEFYLDDILIQCISLPQRATGRIGLIRDTPASIGCLRGWQCSGA